MHLHTLGWNSHFQEHWDARFAEAGSRRIPARVTDEQRGAYRVVSTSGELLAEPTGRLRHETLRRSELPAVGDWVAIETIGNEGKAHVHAVLPRKTTLSRRASGKRGDEQVLAANVDVVLVVTSLNGDFNLPRLERYLSMIGDSGAQPVIVLNKADLCDGAEHFVEQIGTVAPTVHVHALSGRTGQGMDALRPYAGSQQTLVLVGSSGVGKSTITNALLEAEVQETRDVRSSDDRGRHVTTSRRLFFLPGGGMLIDTPGIREIQLWETADIPDAFSDIHEVALRCRFSDCRHRAEPGCAVLQAVTDGALDGRRFSSYQKLETELEHLQRRADPEAAAQNRKRWKEIEKAMKRFKKG